MESYVLLPKTGLKFGPKLLGATPLSWNGNGGPTNAKVTANDIGGIILMVRIIMINIFLVLLNCAIIPSIISKILSFYLLLFSSALSLIVTKCYPSTESHYIIAPYSAS
jgi:hypothetical protein